MKHQSNLDIARKKIEREMSERSEEIDLSGCGLTDWPEELFQMDWLKSLTITNRDTNDGQENIGGQTDPSPNGPKGIRFLHEGLVQLQKLELLHIGGDYNFSWNISDIGILSKLKKLHFLNLSYNRISNIEPLDSLTQLESLIISSNDIHKIDVLGGLSKLTYLEISNNPVSDIRVLRKLTKLTNLALTNTSLSDIESLNPLNKLTDLVLSENRLSDLSPLRSLVRLKSLSLWNNSIQSIDDLAGLKQLSYLDIAGNKVSDLTPIRDITNLQSLWAGDNFIDNISALRNLTNLEKLGLASNSISNADALQRLENLNALHLNDNEIADITPLAGLSLLQELYLERNNVFDISVLRGLEKLTNLNLSRNLIENVQPLQLMDNIKQLRIDDNPIDDCPPEVWQTNDIKAIKAFFDSHNRDSIKSGKAGDKTTSVNGIESGTDQKPLRDLEDVKLIFVGNSDVGKTQMSKYFSEQKIPGRISTKGIRLERWLPDSETLPPFSSLQNKVGINIWDFGGQEYYHGTFRLFLNNYAVYVLLWEQKTNKNELIKTPLTDKTEDNIQHYDFRYWLDNIRHYAPNSPVFIVQNKLDDKDQQKERVDTSIITDYELTADHYVSLHKAAKDGTQNQSFKWGFNLFCSDLSDAMLKIVNKYTKKSSSWLRIRDAVIDLTKANATDNAFSQYVKRGSFITVDDFEKACFQIEPDLTDDEIHTLPKWLNNTGVVIYFGEVEELKNKVYFDPLVITEAIYENLTDSIQIKAGEFEKTDITGMEGINKASIIALMKKMEIIYEKPNEPGKFIAPQCLPETHEVEDLYTFAAKGLQESSYYIKLPLFFFRQVLQRMIFLYGHASDIGTKYYWKHGILFEHNETLVMIKGIESERNDNSGVLIVSTDHSKPTFQDIQREVFLAMIQILQNKGTVSKPPTAKMSISQKQSITKRKNKDDGTILDLLLKEKKTPRWLKRMELSVDAVRFVPYLKLLNTNEQDVTVDTNGGGNVHIHDFQPFLNRKILKPVKVFVSYAHEDIELMRRLSAHLTPLRRLNKIEIWTDNDIEPGADWDSAIKRNMQEANVFLLLLSSDFIASSYIWHKELNKAIEKRDRNEATIIPIYMRPFDFTATRFTETEMIPKNDGNLQAISQWQNLDHAFKAVAEKVREAINARSAI